MDYKEKVKFLEDQVKLMYPEAYFARVDLGRMSGLIILRVKQDERFGHEYTGILSRFGQLDTMLSYALDGDLLEYNVKMEFNVWNGDNDDGEPNTELVIQVSFVFDGVVLI
jgi:hypothetical protein